MKEVRMKEKAKYIVSLMMTAGIAVIFYVILHESGHALTAVLCGAQIHRISIIFAYTSWSGGDFTPVTSALCDAGGVLLPLLIAVTGLCFYRKSVKNPIYHLLYAFYTLTSVGSMLTWVFVPLLSLFIDIPAREDATKFLQKTNMPPIAAAIAALAVILMVVFFAYKKRLISNFIRILKSARDMKESDTCISGKNLFCMTAVLGVFMMIAFLLEIPGIMEKPVIEVTAVLEAGESEAERTYRFDVEKSGVYNFAMELDAAGILTDILILDEAQNIVYQNIAEHMTSEGTIGLSCGTYTLRVVYLTDADSFADYCNLMDYNFDDETMGEFTAVYGKEQSDSSLSVEIKMGA